MAQFVQKAEALPAHEAGGTAFVIAQNARGRWVARERDGLIEGIFLSQREAISFALLKTALRQRCTPARAAQGRSAAP